MVDRGNITAEEYRGFRGNSYEQELMAPALSDEALLLYCDLVIRNCYYDRQRPYRTYNEATMGFVAPELLRRFKRCVESTSSQAKSENIVF